MRLFQNIALVLSLLISSMACTPEDLLIDDVPVAESKIVVSTLFVPEVGVTLAITQNFTALNGGLENEADLLDELLLSNMEVTLSSENERVVLDELNAGVYGTAALELSDGKIYQLEVLDPVSQRMVSATSEVKPFVSIEDLEIELVGNSFDDDSLPKVTFSVQDPPEENWYVFNIQRFQQTPDLLGTVLSNRVYTHLLDDIGKNGELITDEFTTLINDDFSIGDTVVVSMANISQEYYNFLEKRQDSRFQFVSEPFNLPSNVEDGYGFFNLHQPDLRVLILESE